LQTKLQFQVKDLFFFNFLFFSHILNHFIYYLIKTYSYIGEFL